MHFKQLGQFDYKPILNEIVNAPLWNWLALRSYAGHTDDIVLRYQSVVGLKQPQDFFSDLECVDYFTQTLFPNTMQQIHRTFADKQLGRIVIAKLAPGQEIKPHTDEGLYSDSTDRYHMAVVTNPECIITSGGFNQQIGRGEIWWINNHQTHSAHNHGTTNRIHIIVDTYK
jgi:hypothetical protein